MFIAPSQHAVPAPPMGWRGGIGLACTWLAVALAVGTIVAPMGNSLAQARAPAAWMAAADTTSKVASVVVELWSGPPTPALPSPPTTAECTGERLGRVRLHHPPGGGDLPGPLDIPLFTGPNGLSPVSVDIPDPARLLESQCLRVGLGLLYREVAHVALPVAPAVQEPSSGALSVTPRLA